MRPLLAAALLLTLTAATPDERALAPLAFEQVAPAGTKMPRFKVDAAWPTMPADLLLGQARRMEAAGRRDEALKLYRAALATIRQADTAANKANTATRAATGMVITARRGKPGAHYRLGWEEKEKAGGELVPGMIDLPGRMPEAKP